MSPESTRRASRFSDGPLKSWLTLARVSNSPTVVSNVLAGAALAGIYELNERVIMLMVAMVLYYTAGMVLNDVCDSRWDNEHRPTRPIPSGAVTRNVAIGAVVALFAVGSAILWFVAPAALLSGLVLIGVIAFYDVWHKSNPLSPVVMAACRVMVYVTAFVSFAWPLSERLIAASIIMVLYMVGLTAIAKSEVRPKMTGYWPASILLAGPVFFALRSPSALTFALAGALIAWTLISLQTVYRPEDRNIGAAIANLIAGISILDALVMASSGAVSTISGAMVAFALTLLFQKYVEGT